MTRGLGTHVFLLWILTDKQLEQIQGIHQYQYLEQINELQLIWYSGRELPHFSLLTVYIID